jgi:5-formyltetrahydrofolate cyclo-ligase
MLKSELRLKYKELKKQLSEEDIERNSLVIANHLLSVPIWDKTYFHVFLPIVERHEVNTQYILHILSGRDKEVIVSKSNFTTLEMIHFLLTDNTKFKKNEYNIPEPIDGIEVPSYKIQVVIVPLMAFDKKGHRVGFGKGFYDKLLSECKSDTVKIGVSFFEAEEIISNTGDHDIKLDYCVTPKKVYTF